MLGILITRILMRDVTLECLKDTNNNFTIRLQTSHASGLLLSLNIMNLILKYV